LDNSNKDIKDDEEDLKQAEFLVIETQGMNISFYYINNGLPAYLIREINERGEGWSMGSVNARMIIRPQLLMVGDLRQRESEQVLEFGQALISYANLTDKTVGDPCKYGIDAILIHERQQCFTFERQPIISKNGMERRFEYRWQQ
jgi:hypothetical protein